MKGSYILIIHLAEAQKIKVGALGAFDFSFGFYAYVGSAMGGFGPRLRRHLKKAKKPRWHIDYLLEKASIRSIILSESREKTECLIARTLEPQFAFTPGFGSSDCSCQSHLFYRADERQMESGIIKTLNLLSYPVQPIEGEKTKAP